MIDVNELRKGVTFEQDNSLFKVLEYSHNKPGRGSATIKIKARDLRKGTTLEMTFISGNRVQDVRLEYHNAQFLYSDDQFFYFMNTHNYEQYPIGKDIVSDMSGLPETQSGSQADVLRHRSAGYGTPNLCGPPGNPRRSLHSGRYGHRRDQKGRDRDRS